MDEALKQALEIVRAQARVRAMTADEMASMVKALAASIQGLMDGGPPEEHCEEEDEDGVVLEATKSIRERSVLCLECGKSFRILTTRHLASHGLTPDEYRAKWGIKKGGSLICKALQRERRKKMKSMQLWERRRKA
ncbi:MucR family transcriptional regulator [Nitratidesulfovibrio vulgaris]|uniref:Transcriptional regulator, MucR family n=1 Tax=Nitratidesulfovibrio vulgaris (strain DP4) TaxID=391774 RepID=A0A0H3A614_NITV4|nr:MucR family transcriptional regulator [Nitratidesulfovibrio vulgaris]ABM27895.1 transcriptional regulator, MucR family [Nitratidesulfovibrio vulgaris DP4]